MLRRLARAATQQQRALWARGSGSQAGIPTHVVDLRIDTVTKPGPAMRRSMAEAVVGDDDYGEDPTVRELQATAAELLGVKQTLFVPTNTMANLISGAPAGPELWGPGSPGWGPVDERRGGSVHAPCPHRGAL
ncbi:uncharacterized protein R102.4-like [Pseudorca crassidens]|uniref:uncharacterized protein R102.4-like n=1 Tax=Pseudorca crassidens TaxID=82174 RepID=UPI00352E14BB